MHGIAKAEIADHCHHLDESPSRTDTGTTRFPQAFMSSPRSRTAGYPSAANAGAESPAGYP
jgi:hypothetical protein